MNTSNGPFLNSNEAVLQFQQKNAALEAEKHSLQEINQNIAAEKNFFQAKALYYEQMNFTKEAQVQSLLADIERMKAEKYENPRSFAELPNGDVYSIEPSGHRKHIGFFRFQGAELISVEKEQHLRIDYYGDTTCIDAALIPVNEIDKGNLVKHFRSFTRLCSKELANAFLYWIIKKALLNPDIKTSFYPSRPGIYYTFNNGAVTDAYYEYYSNDADDILLSRLPENFTRKSLPGIQITFGEAINSIRPYLTENAAYVLLAYAIAGLFASFLELTQYRLPVILSVSTPHAEAESLAGCILKTYEKEKQPYSLTMSKTELTHILSESYCETVVLNDNTTAKSDVKRASAIDTIINFPANPEYKPHNIAILSSSIHYFVPAGNILPISLSERFGKGFSVEERSKLIRNLYGMLEYIGNEYCAFVDRYYHELSAELRALRAEEHGFESENEKTTFAVLYGMLRFWAKIFRTELPNDLKSYLVQCISEAQDTEYGRDHAIVNCFYRTLSNGIAAGTLTVSELNGNMQFRTEQNILIHDCDLLLTEESTFKNVFLPQIQTAATVNMILSALEHEGYLVSTNGHRKPTTVYDEYGDPRSMKLIAFRYRDMVRKETAMYIDNMKQMAYFGKEVPDRNYLPLVKDAFGKTACQLLKNGSNQHRFVTGRSGSGKTRFLMTLLYHLTVTGNRIVVFDSNAAFTKRELSELLPEAFINDNITFYNVTADGLPVDLLHVYEDDKCVARRNMLFSIIGSAIQDASQRQEIALKNMINSILDQTAAPEYIDLIEAFDNAEGSSEISVANKLRDLFEDIINGKETKADWSSFLEYSKSIVILSVDENFSNSGNQLMDMLLTSLWYAQCHEDEPHQLSLFIDEIHNQNLNENSIIARILREGRKHHIDLNFATQYLNDIKQSRLLKQAGLCFYFRPDTASRTSVAEQLHLKKSETYKLDHLAVGECFVQGAVYNFELGDSEEAVIYGKVGLISD